MSKKEIKALPEGFLKAFGDKAAYAPKNVVSEETEVKVLEAKLSESNRKINAARIGGVGNVGKLSEEKARIQLALQEAYKKAAKKEAMDPVGKADADIDNDGDVDSSDEYLHKRRKAIGKAMKKEEVEVLDESKALLKDYEAMKAQGKKDHNIMDVLMSMPKYKKMSRDQMAKVIGDAKRKGIFKEDVELDEAKLDAYDFESMDPPKGIDYDAGNLRKVKWKMYDNAALKSIISRNDNALDDHGIDGKGNPLRKYHEAIIKAAKAELKKRGIKEDVEITELHMSLLEAHGIEKKVAERVKKVFDAMSDADKAAFMKAYLKNPKAATDHMFSSMKKMAEGVDTSEEKKLDEVLDDPKSMDRYRSKAKMSSDRAKNSATANRLRGTDDSKDMKTIDKREKGLKMVDRNAARKFRKEEVELDEAEMSLYDKIKAARANPSPDKPVRGRGSKNRNPKTYNVRNTLDKEDDRLQSMVKKKLKKEEVELEENYTINHKTFSAAVQHAKSQVEKKGYTIDDDEWDRKVAMGPKKPGTGKTNRYTIALMKGGKETKRNLQMQVYYDEGRYELNMYVS